MAVVTYDNLRSHLGRRLGYSEVVATIAANSTWSYDVELLLGRALRRTYNPPLVSGRTKKHMWSFLKPTIPMTFISGSVARDLPTNYVSIDGPLVYPMDDGAIFPICQITSPENVLKKLALNSAGGRPLWAAPRVKGYDEANAQTTYELIAYPVPDDDYAFSMQMTIDPLIIGVAGDVPPGGQALSETLLAACDAEVERFNDLEGNKAELMFRDALASAIAHDEQISSPHSLGYNADHSDGALVGDWRDLHTGLVAYEGETW